MDGGTRSSDIKKHACVADPRQRIILDRAGKSVNTRPFLPHEQILPDFLIAACCTVSALLGARGQSNYEPYSFSTFASEPSAGSRDGIGNAARFWSPLGVAIDSAGNVFVADEVNNTIRKVDTAGGVTTIAGHPNTPGSTDGPVQSALFYNPFGVAFDSAGNLYVTDTSNNTIRKITVAGQVTTLAGLAGVPGSTDGVGAAARLWGPKGIILDNSGNVYVSDEGNETIRKITPAGVVTTLAGSPGKTGLRDGLGAIARFYNPENLAIDGAGIIYVADSGSKRIRKVTPAGLVSTLKNPVTNNSYTLGGQPYGVAVDGADNVYVAVTTGQVIRKILLPARIACWSAMGTRSAVATEQEQRHDLIILLAWQ